MSYAIFRVQGIKTTGDLRGIGKHNLERVSYTNLDIDASRFGENIHLIQPPESKTYVKNFFEIVEPMKLEHEEKMKNERKDRVKPFEAKINSSKSDVACEFLFTSDEEFFKDMSKAEVERWAETSLDFVKKEIGIPEEHILHAVVHMDEKTPHLHIVAVPLVQKYDGRAKKETWQLNRKHFIRTREDMGKLQDSYHGHMQKHGYGLERGVKGSTNRHLHPERFKAQEDLKRLETQQKALEGVVEDLGYQKEMLDMDIQELVEAVDLSVQVESIPVEKGGLFDRRSVRMAFEDFERIKTLAKASEGLKTSGKALKTQVRGLNDQNIALKNANEQLKKEKQKLVMAAINLEKENTALKKDLNWFKTLVKFFEDAIKHMKINFVVAKVAPDLVEQIVGYSKTKSFKENINANNPSMILKTLPASERVGAEGYLRRWGKEQQKVDGVKEVDEQPVKIELEEQKKTNDDFEIDR